MSTFIFAPVSDLEKSQVGNFSMNLAQAAATYDLATASGDLIIDKIAFYVTAAGTVFTSVSVQTNQTTPAVLLSAVEGAVANVVSQKTMTIALTAPVVIKSGQKIQFTIVGATGTGTIVATAVYRPTTAGARLA